MSDKSNEFYGMAVICDLYGRIEHVLRNDLCEEVDLGEKKSLTALIDTNSVQKFFTFLYRLKEEKALYDWNINVCCNDSLEELYFVGGMYEDYFLIVASTSRKVAGSYFSDLMQMNNEQTNLIRSTIKQTAGSGMYRGEGEDDEMFQDFTRLNNELANLQRDLQKKNSKLEQTIKERDRYIGMAAHDLRNPLGGFQGLLGFLLDEDFGPINEEQREVLSQMKDSAEHMLAMVNEILDVSSFDSGTLKLDKRKSDIIEIIKGSIGINRPIARKKRISLELDSDHDELELPIDKGKINQVVDNLISNAIKYSYPDTRVTVRLRSGEAEDGEGGEKSDNDSNRCVRVEVVDEGQGIPEEDKSKLFEPFSDIRTETTGGERSTGLGLAITRRIVEGHGGTIDVESTSGEGSVFRFTLPVEGMDGEDVENV